MESDRELLELAAKAAGIDLQWMGEGRMAACFDPAGENEWWNPLTDDGDALRLAVKLGIELTSFSDMVAANGLTEDRCSDDYAATRRAIVRVAAEIGKAMTWTA